MSPGLDWPRAKGERLRSGGVRMPTVGITTISYLNGTVYWCLFLLHYHSEQLCRVDLISPIVRDTSSGRLSDLPKVTEALWVGWKFPDRSSWKSQFFPATYGHVASCNKYSIPSLIHPPDPPLKEWLINVLFHLLIILLKFSIHGPSQAWVPFQGRICI